MLFLKVLIYFFSLLFFTFLLLLFVKVKVTVLAETKKTVVRLGIVFFQFTIYPSNWKHRQKTKTVSGKKEIKEEKQKPHSEYSMENMSIGELTDFSLDMLRAFEDAVTIDTLHVDFIIATRNAARTGLLLGQASAAAGLLLPYLDSHFAIRDRSINIDADFGTEQCRWDINFTASTRPIKSLVILLRNYKKIWRFIKKLRKVEGTQA